MTETNGKNEEDWVIRSQALPVAMLDQWAQSND
jgi:hypothetical protein